MFGWVGRVRSWWGETPRAVRWVVYICVPLGVLAIRLGIYGDGHGWWDNRSFLTNLASSFASLLFGVPLALLVLSHLSAMQESVAARKAAQQQARRVWKRFNQAFLDRFPERDLVGLAHDIEEIAQGLDALGARVARIMLGNERASYQEIEAAAREFRDFGERQKLVIPPQRITVWLADVARQWKILDEEIRPLVESTNLAWMTTHEALEHSRAFQTLQDPEHLRAIDNSALLRLEMSFTQDAPEPDTWEDIDEARVAISASLQWVKAMHLVTLLVAADMSEMV